MKILIKNAIIVNENKQFCGSVIIENDIIKDIVLSLENVADYAFDKIIDATGKYLFPGVIDDHVHFREPGMTQNGDIETESRAALAGGVTSFMDMPNNIPAATTIQLLENKYEAANKKSHINYSFYFGATNENIDELKRINPKNVCGVKVFMGSSTGNMLVDNEQTLENVFAASPTLVATHCEDETIIRQNIDFYKNKYGENIDFSFHSKIRSTEACVKSTRRAVELALKHNAHLHVLHISTAKELEIIEKAKAQGQITAETCVHYLTFCDKDYNNMKGRVKCNPSIKTEADREALQRAVSLGVIDVVATDHAPHLADKKQQKYFSCPSGLPLVQHSLNAMLELAKQNILSLETIVEHMCHAPARVFKIKNRGFIRQGYKADLTLVNPNKTWVVDKNNILYKCAWSPFEGKEFNYCVEKVFVNGNLLYDNGLIDNTICGERLMFAR